MNVCPLEECKFELTPASCSGCPGRPKPEPAEPIQFPGVTFAAKFPGHCRGCNLPIVEGQRIHRVNDRFVHAGCGS